VYAHRHRSLQKSSQTTYRSCLCRRIRPPRSPAHSPNQRQKFLRLLLHWHTPCLCLSRHRGALILQEPPSTILCTSQNHRIPARQGLAGPSVGHPAQPPAQAGSPGAGGTAPRPGGARISPEKKTSLGKPNPKLSLLFTSLQMFPGDSQPGAHPHWFSAERSSLCNPFPGERAGMRSSDGDCESQEFTLRGLRFGEAGVKCEVHGTGARPLRGAEAEAQPSPPCLRPRAPGSLGTCTQTPTPPGQLQWPGLKDAKM